MPLRGALARALQAVVAWREAMRGPELFWSVICPPLFVVIASLATGLLVVLVLNAPSVMRNSQQPVQNRTAIPSRIEVTTAAGLFDPAPVANTPMATPVAVRTPPPVATATAAPSADAAWLAILPSLDAAWGRDTPATLVLLNAFHARFPQFQPAREKLYAALIANAKGLAEAGASNEAAGQLTFATAVLPERGEARAELLAIAATAARASDLASDGSATVDDSRTSTDANQP